MPWTDMREFLGMLEERGDLLRISDEVDWEYEAVDLTRQTSDVDGPALLFEKVRDSDVPCLSGIFAAKRRVAWALEVDEDDLFEVYREREKVSLPAQMTDEAPCQEVVLTGDDIDLYRLPILRHYELDGGRYITAALQVANDPESGTRNVSIHRMLLLGKNRLSVYAPPGRQLRTIIERHAERGGAAEIASVFAAEPATQIASQARAPYGVDEFDIAGGLRGEPITLTRCATIDVAVPASAEMVIEGRIIPGEMVDDGPFGEYPGTYSSPKPAPVLEVTAITMRRDGMYQNTLTGMPMTENHWMMQPAAAAMAYREAYKVAPEVKAVNVTAGGSARHHVVVSIRKRHPSDARNTMLALLAAPLGAKQVIVVDEDIDVFDPVHVEWAVNTRVQPDKDVVIIPNLYSPTLDPSSPENRMTAKMGIDATMPTDEAHRFLPPRILGSPPRPLADYLADSRWSQPAGDFRR
jgi:2,5-furandicarboxylate decarboxylase 1